MAGKRIIKFKSEKEAYLASVLSNLPGTLFAAVKGAHSFHQEAPPLHTTEICPLFPWGYKDTQHSCCLFSKAKVPTFISKTLPVTSGIFTDAD